MKVIGIVKDKDTILVEIGVTELANIGGQIYAGHDLALTDSNGKAFDGPADAINVGDVLSVCPIFDRAREIVEAHDDVKKTLSKVKGSITTYENAVKTRGDA